MIKQDYRFVALAQRVLAVASISYDEATWTVIDWAVYIDAVPGKNHPEEYMRVAETGDKQPLKIAALLFPALDIKKYRNSTMS